MTWRNIVIRKPRAFSQMVRALNVALIAVLTACSSGSLSLPAGPSAASDAVQPAVTIANFKRVVAWGPKGTVAVAQCPPGYKIVAGGSSSSNGASVGTGFADFPSNAWIVKPPSNASAEAFASCVGSKEYHKTFRWISAGPIPSSNLAEADCPHGWLVVTGFGVQGTVTASWVNGNTYWVEGGAIAYASCARPNDGVIVVSAWNKSQKPKTVYAGCGSGYTDIGGSMGDVTWPGPPIQQHPGLASGPATHGYSGFWTFSNANNELTWASCVRS
jgi:hypothetical protein